MTIEATDLLDAEQVAALLGVTAASLRTMRAQPERHRSIDGLPAPLRRVSDRPVWATSDILAWHATRRRTYPGRDEAPAVP